MSRRNIRELSSETIRELSSKIITAIECIFIENTETGYIEDLNAFLLAIAVYIKTIIKYFHKNDPDRMTEEVNTIFDEIIPYILDRERIVESTLRESVE